MITYMYVYVIVVNKRMSRIWKVCRGLDLYGIWPTECFVALQPSGGDAALKTLACKYGAVLQKIGLECIKFSVKLQTFCKAMLW